MDVKELTELLATAEGIENLRNGGQSLGYIIFREAIHFISKSCVVFTAGIFVEADSHSRSLDFGNRCIEDLKAENPVPLGYEECEEPFSQQRAMSMDIVIRVEQEFLPHNTKKIILNNYAIIPKNPHGINFEIRRRIDDPTLGASYDYNLSDFEIPLDGEQRLDARVLVRSPFRYILKNNVKDYMTKLLICLILLPHIRMTLFVFIVVILAVGYFLNLIYIRDSRLLFI